MPLKQNTTNVTKHNSLVNQYMSSGLEYELVVDLVKLVFALMT